MMLRPPLAISSSTQSLEQWLAAHRRQWRRARGALGWLAVALVIAALGGLAYRHGQNPFDQRAFDAQAWKQALIADPQRNPRGAMVHDLRNKYLDRGVIREQAIALLGRPDHQSKPNVLIYKLGRHDAPVGQQNWLVLTIDHKERVREARIETY